MAYMPYYYCFCRNDFYFFTGFFSRYMQFTPAFRAVSFFFAKFMLYNLNKQILRKFICSKTCTLAIMRFTSVTFGSGWVRSAVASTSLNMNSCSGYVYSLDAPYRFCLASQSCVRNQSTCFSSSAILRSFSSIVRSFSSIALIALSNVFIEISCVFIKSFYHEYSLKSMFFGIFLHLFHFYIYMICLSKTSFLFSFFSSKYHKSFKYSKSITYRKSTNCHRSIKHCRSFEYFRSFIYFRSFKYRKSFKIPYLTPAILLLIRLTSLLLQNISVSIYLS